MLSVHNLNLQPVQIMSHFLRALRHNFKALLLFQYPSLSDIISYPISSSPQMQCYLHSHTPRDSPNVIFRMLLFSRQASITWQYCFMYIALISPESDQLY